MALEFVTISEMDFSGGIDAQSAENTIAEKFAQDILNMDIVGKSLAKRTGYKRVAGHVPVRARKVENNTNLENNLCLTLDSAIDLSLFEPHPIMIGGRTSTSNSLNEGTFQQDIDNYKWFPTYHVKTRLNFPASESEITVVQSSSSLPSSLLFMEVAQSISTTDFSHEIFIPQSLSIHIDTLDVTIGYNSAVDFEGYLYTSDKSNNPGRAYVHPVQSLAAQSGESYQITAGIHQLDNFKIIAKVYEVTPTHISRIIPQAVTINKITGRVQVQVINNTNASLNILVILSAVPQQNEVTGQIPAQSTQTIVIPNFQGRFPILGVYLESLVNQTLEQVIPSSIIYNDLTKEVSVTFNSNLTESVNARIYYESGQALINTLCVTDILDETTNIITLPSADTSITEDVTLDSTILIADIFESLVDYDDSNIQVYPEDFSFDPTSMQIDYSVGSDTDINISYINPDPVNGSNYISGTYTVTASSSDSIVINAATHGLTSDRLLIRVYEIDSGRQYRIFPESVTINKATLSVTINIVNMETSDIDLVVAIVEVPSTSSISDSVPASSVDTITFAAYEPKWFIGNIYEDTGTELIEIIADRIEYNDVNELLEIDISNNEVSPINIRIQWAPVVETVIRRTLESLVSANYVDNLPQLSIWGFDHSNLYSTEDRSGWVNYIDTYKNPTKEEVLCGLGGNIYRNIDHSSIPTAFVNLANRLQFETRVGPLFSLDSDNYFRDSGSIQGTNVVNGYVPVTSISRSGSTMTVRANIQNLDPVDENGTTTALSSVLDNRYEVQLRGSIFKRNNGTYKIQSYSLIDSTTIEFILITTNNPIEFNEPTSTAQLGIFIDQLDLFNPSTFIPGDSITIQNNELDIHTVVSSASDILYISDVNDEATYFAGTNIIGERTSSIVPIKDTRELEYVGGIVPGDVINLGYDNSVIVSVNPINSQSIDITVNNGTEITTVILSNVNTSAAEGTPILLVNAREYSGVQYIRRWITDSTFEIDYIDGTSSFTNARLIGNTIELDQEVELTNNQLVDIPSRWIPIEAPVDTFDKTIKTYISHFDSESYVNKSFIRSTMVNNNMYFTNASDEVMKYDGENIYRAGLFKWNPGMFVTQDNSAATIIVNTPSVSVDDVSNNTFEVAVGDETAFSIGDRIRFDDATIITDYVITDIPSPTDSATEALIIVDKNISGDPTGTITKISTYRYYFRLNLVDRNNNIIASGYTGPDNCIVDVAENTAIKLGLIGFPNLGIYDYARLELEIYRTLLDTGPTAFYKLTSIPLELNVDNSYITYTDTTSDEELQDNTQVDITSTLDNDTFLSATWQEPQRARYTTSVNNRLVLADLKSYPEVDITLNPVSTSLVNIADVYGLHWKFNKNSASAAPSVTDMTNSIIYEIVHDSVDTVFDINSISTSANERTVDIGTHSLVIGDWVYIYNETLGNANSPELCGLHQIIDVAAETFTIYSTVDAANVTAAKVIVANDPTNIPVFVGEDGNRHTRGNQVAELLSPLDLVTNRLADAINMSMRACVHENFTPWLIAQSGADMGIARILIKQPYASSILPEIILPQFLPSVYNVFVNQLKKLPEDQVDFNEHLRPSDIAYSYPNFPEIFAPSNQRSINKSDGQEITGIVSFFSDSTTTAAAKEAALLIFKTNSIHVFNVVNQQTDPQKLETGGIGCSFPYSITHTNNGIMFAHLSGIYKVDTNFKLIDAGDFVNRIWLDSVDRTNRDLIHANNYSIQKQYKLSIPFNGANYPEDMLVYDHSVTSQQSNVGSWTRHNNIPSIGWSNASFATFFATDRGIVMQLRDTEEQRPYRDETLPINSSTLLRAMDFGEGGSRKNLGVFISHFRVETPMTGTNISVICDSLNDFEDTNTVTDTDALSLVPNISQANKLVSIKSSSRVRRFLYIQLLYSNGTLDENMEFAGVSFRVARGTHKGIREAADG